MTMFIARVCFIDGNALYFEIENDPKLRIRDDANMVAMKAIERAINIEATDLEQLLFVEIVTPSARFEFYPSSLKEANVS